MNSASDKAFAPQDQDCMLDQRMVALYADPGALVRRARKAHLASVLRASDLLPAGGLAP